jgi:putative RNA 2'-phosphotransferase
MPTDIEISKAISHALRHEPWIHELELDEAGWADLDSLLESLRRGSGDWAALTRADVERMISNSEKKRHEISGNRIRAGYGHSLPGKLVKEEAVPPGVLYHGTSPGALEVIRRMGLLPMARQYVHMSIDTETAAQVGKRKCPAPVILRIDSAAAHARGIKFFSGNEKVWLSLEIPKEFIGET